MGLGPSIGVADRTFDMAAYTVGLQNVATGETLGILFTPSRSFSCLQTVGGDSVITAVNGAQLTLLGVDTAALATLAGNFSFV